MKQTTEAKVFKYLDALHKSGIANMFGAVPWIKGAFSRVSHDQAVKLLADWMRTFEQRHPQSGKRKP